MSDEFVKIGVVAAAFQLDGALKIRLTTDFVQRFNAGNRIFIELGSFKKECYIKSFSLSGKSKGILTLSHLTTREDAEKYSGSDILIPASESHDFADQLDENEFLYSDLIGASAYRDDELFGKVVELYEGGGGVILVIEREGREYELPFVDEMVDTSRFAENRIDITPVEGLFDE